MVHLDSPVILKFRQPYQVSTFAGTSVEVWLISQVKRVERLVKA